MTRLRRLSFARALPIVLLAGCGPVEDEQEPVASVRQEVSAPLPEAYCSIQVDGSGAVDTEDDYLPHVIQCENGGADIQALKAQAIAARSVAYYNMATSGSICDGQGCQVYSCGATPGAIHHQAVAETSGMYLSFADTLTYGFYVAGDNNTSPPSCVGSTGSTEHWVTYNEGKTGGDVEQTELGYVGPPGFGQNRGCMSQWGARCLEAHKGYDYKAILRFYYGDDIQILTAPGSCVAPTLPDLDASFVAAGSDAAPATNGVADYEVCAGSTFHFWFEVENTGGAEWVDTAGSSVGTAVRLGVPGDGADPLTGAGRISLNENANDSVRSGGVNPPGGDCNDAPSCRRTRFVDGAGIEATAPSIPGMVSTQWQLVDEGRSWFGPVMGLTFDVVDCGSGTGGSGGAGGGSGSGGASGTGGAGGAAGSAGSAGQTGGASGGSDVGSYYQAEDADGCACRTGNRGGRVPWWMAVGLLLVGTRRWRLGRHR